MWLVETTSRGRIQNMSGWVKRLTGVMQTALWSGAGTYGLIQERPRVGDQAGREEYLALAARELD
jgi:hypothetical protein